MNYRVAWILLFVLGLMFAFHNQVFADTSLAQPQAAMVVVASDDSRQVVLDFGDAQANVETMRIPAMVQVTVISASPLPSVVQALLVPTTPKKYLLLKGEATATPAPTQTPYLPRAVAPVTVVPPNQLHTDTRTPGARFVALTCPQCPPNWDIALLNQLPDYAPIVVYAPGLVTLPGAWLIHVKAVAGSALPDLGRVVHLFERTPQQTLTVLQWRTGAVAEATYPPERMVQVDGRPSLLRIIFCLVAVLFCSMASFYLAIAVMRRMHSAVGYKPEQ